MCFKYVECSKVEAFLIRSMDVIHGSHECVYLPTWMVDFLKAQIRRSIYHSWWQEFGTCGARVLGMFFSLNETREMMNWRWWWWWWWWRRTLITNVGFYIGRQSHPRANQKKTIYRSPRKAFSSIHFSLFCHSQQKVDMEQVAGHRTFWNPLFLAKEIAKHSPKPQPFFL